MLFPCSVRIFSRRTQKNLSTVLPPPSVSPLHSIKSVAYNRVVSVVYLLINNTEIWVYTTRFVILTSTWGKAISFRLSIIVGASCRTDPACRIAVWNVLEIQQKIYQERFGGGGNGEDGQSSKGWAGWIISKEKQGSLLGVSSQGWCQADGF